MKFQLNMTITYKDNELTVDYNDGSAQESHPIPDDHDLQERVRQLIQDEIDEFNRIDKYMMTATDDFFSCAGCGTRIKTGDKIIICSDCGGVFCETCAHDGTFENHECEEDDEE